MSLLMDQSVFSAQLTANFPSNYNNVKNALNFFLEKVITHKRASSTKIYKGIKSAYDQDTVFCNLKMSREFKANLVH